MHCTSESLVQNNLWCLYRMRLSHVLQKQLHCVSFPFTSFTFSVEDSWVEDFQLNVESTHTVSISSLRYITVQLQTMHIMHCLELGSISKWHSVCVTKLWLFLYSPVHFFFFCFFFFFIIIIIIIIIIVIIIIIMIIRMDTPGDSFNNVVLQTMNLALPWVSVRKLEFPCWLSYSLRYCVQKKSYFYRWYKKIKTEYYYSKCLQYYYSKCFHYQKLVKITIKSERLDLCKIIVDLKTQATKFWKYVSLYNAAWCQWFPVTWTCSDSRSFWIAFAISL